MVRKSKTAWNGIEELERRVLLSANAPNIVHVSFPTDGVVQIEGDEASNEVGLSTDGGGGLIITALDDTKLQLDGDGGGVFTQDPDTGEIFGDGVVADGLQINVNTQGSNRKGGDFVDMTNFNAEGALVNVAIDMGRGGFTTVSLDTAVVNDLNLFKRGAGGSEVDIIDSQITGAFSADFRRSTGSDEINISGSAIGGPVSVSTGAGSDDFNADTSTFADTVSVNLGAGPDAVSITEGNEFDGDVNVDFGGRGTRRRPNVLDDDGTSTFLANVTVNGGFEGAVNSGNGGGGEEV